ncbi:MAG: helix-turn-helix domain-containing protein [Solirubrobacteraceae bacterium]
MTVELREGQMGGRERRRSSLEDVRAGVAERLRARRPEIEETIFARIRESGYSHVGGDDPEYVAGLRGAIAAAVELGLMGLEMAGAPLEGSPSAIVEQARRAARLGVSLDTVLCRYIAGQALLAEFIMEEALRSGFSGDEASLHRDLRRTQTPLLEFLTASVIQAYADEIDRVAHSPEQRRGELVRGLLASKQLDIAVPAELGYDFDAWHVGVIAAGPRSADFVRGATAAVGRECLSVADGQRAIWAWLGRRVKPTTADIERIAGERLPGVRVAMGEPRWGIEGWRLTHREAQAALLVARHGQPALVRCSDVVLEAAVLQHDAMTTCLVETFLSPLDGLVYRGQTARDTLRAYFDVKRNVSSTAQRLGVVRNTVESRLREIEERLDRPLHACSAQLEVALRLEALNEDDTDTEKTRHLAAKWSNVAGRSAIRGWVEQSAQSPRARLSTLASHSRVMR